MAGFRRAGHILYIASCDHVINMFKKFTDFTFVYIYHLVRIVWLPKEQICGHALYTLSYTYILASTTLLNA